MAALATFGLVVRHRSAFVAELLIGLLIGMALPHLVIGRMGKRRVAAFIALFPDAIDLMVRALALGPADQ